MDKKGRKVFFLYFKNLFEWFSVVTVIFSAVFILAILLNGWNTFQVTIPICWGITILLSGRTILYCIKVFKEIRSGTCMNKKIIISTVEIDKMNNFYAKGGAVLGNAKILITDINGEIYRMAVDKTEYYCDLNGFKGKEVEIAYLPESKFVLGMKF